MSILSAWLGWDDGDEMARGNTKPLDTAKIDAWVSKLKLAVRDDASFKRLFADIAAEKSLAAAEVVAIASRFAGGAKAKSRKAALTMIAQERQRVAHAKAKGDSAAKTRVW